MGAGSRVSRLLGLAALGWHTPHMCTSAHAGCPQLHLFRASAPACISDVNLTLFRMPGKSAKQYRGYSLERLTWENGQAPAWSTRTSAQVANRGDKRGRQSESATTDNEVGQPDATARRHACARCRISMAIGTHTPMGYPFCKMSSAVHGALWT